MAGVTMLAYGVVFVLLIGEIDLSISYVSGVAGVVVAQLTMRQRSQIDTGRPGLARDRRRDRSPAPRSALFQGSIVALIGVPAFVVTLAGYSIWQGVIQKSIPQGVIVIQDNTVNNVAELLLLRSGRLDHRLRRSPASTSSVALGGVLVSAARHGVAVRDPAARRRSS